jgi:hypothetical protein
MTMAFDSRSFRNRVAQHLQVTFDELDTSPKHFALSFEQDLDKMLESGWELQGTTLPSLAPPLPWTNFDRSFLYHMHAWEPLTFLLKGHCTIANPESCARYFKVSFDYAVDWLTNFQIPVINLDPALLLDEGKTETNSFAWYDMAVGQRIYRLAYILDTVCRDSSYSQETVELLYRSLEFHHRLLAIDKFFNAHSNHGLYQALGQLAAAKRFMHVDTSSAHYLELATERLNGLISAHFTQDNVHKEHSPGYHYMILGSLTGARQTDLIVDKATFSRVQSMEDALVWMIKPNFCIATFGDTDPRPMVRSYHFVSRFKSLALQAVLSEGKTGVFPDAGVRVYYDAGYVFARLFAKDAELVFTNASYLAQIAAFHSRVHKHADHLSFVWFDKHRDILIDPGRYAYAGRTSPDSDLFKQGFWYSDPKRIYCESTRAHNTVEVDGKSFPRAKVKPFGSALVYAGEVDGCAVTYCEATHFRSVRHNRQLVMAPGHFLLVLDWLYDRTGTAHEYRQNFHFAPEWEVVGKDGMIWGQHTGSDSAVPLDIRVASLIPEAILGPVIRGQEEPELLGWISDAANSLIPTSCFGVSQSSSGQCSFATLFVFGQSLEIDWAATRFNRTLSSGKIVWQDDRGKHVLSVSKPVRPVQTDLAK